VATVAAIVRAGAVPVLVDVDPATYAMDPGRLEDAVRAVARGGAGRPRAVVVVHLYGLPADLAALRDVCQRHSLLLVEDCAQSHGALYRGRAVGAWGDAAGFSFYPTKNLGAFGDGGAVVTSDPAVAERVRLLREFGWRERQRSEMPGCNSRLDELQAAILRVRLRALAGDNERRRRHAQLYQSALAGTDVGLPLVPPEREHVFHQYVVRSPDRASLRAHLGARGIASAIHYPLAVHQQPGYGALVVRLGKLVESERTASEVLSLPMYPQLDPSQVEEVAAAVRVWSRRDQRRPVSDSVAPCR
jgi:dTDP-4-amino-4,6-dideoxygalactose transaminase